MKLGSYIATTALLVPILTLTALGQFPADRKLTDASGRNLDATVLAESDGSIRIQRKSDGKEFDFPVAKLSAADRTWLQSIKNKPESPPVAKAPNEIRPPTTAPAPNPPPKPLTSRPVQPAKPSTPVDPSFPPAAAPLPIDEILAAQRKSGVIQPPDGWTALKITLRFKDGRFMPGYVYDVKEDQFWYAAADMIQKSARLTELSPQSRVEIHKWRNQSRYAGSPAVDLTIDGKQICASILHSDKSHLLLLTENGDFKENVPVSSLDETSRKFVEAWNAKTWEPAVATWVISPQFTAVRAFTDDGHALTMQGGKWGIIDRLGNFVIEPRFDEVVEILDSPNLKVRENGNWGLLGNGSQLTVPPEWEDVGDLHHGMIPVRRNNKWGYVQPGGKLAIPCTWDDAWRFSTAGLAVVTSHGKRGFIDRSGKVVMKPEWDGAIMHSPEGIGAVRRGSGWALVDRSGKLLCEPIWKFHWEDRRFELGFIPAWIADQKKYSARETLLGIDGKPGAAPRLGKGVCLPVHPTARTSGPDRRQRMDFGYNRGSRADYVRQRVKEQAYSAPPGQPFPWVLEEKKIGLIDTLGKSILKAEWEEIAIHSKDVILVRRYGKWGLTDSKGNMKIQANNDNIYVLNQQLVATQTGLENPRIVNISSGESSARDFQHWTIKSLPNGSFGAESGSAFRYYWPDGSEVLKADQVSLVYVDNYGNDLIYREGTAEAPQSWWRADYATRNVTKMENAARIYWNKSLSDLGRIWVQDQASAKWHFCTIDGSRLGPVMDQKPEQWFMDDGLGIIWENATCHFINKEGQLVGEKNWEDARILRYARAAVKRNGRWGFMDEKGHLAVDCLYEDVGDFFSTTYRENDRPPVLAAACKFGRWGYIDSDGKEIVPHVGEVRGRWEQGQIHFGTQSRAWSSAVIFNTNGSRVDATSAKLETRNNPLAGKWTTIQGGNGRVGISDETGKVILDTEWRFIKWVAQGVAAVRGKHGGGLFSPEAGWLYQDSDRDRILRDESGVFDNDFLQHGFVMIEQTPKWGYARWKKDAISGLLAAYDFNGDPQDSSGGGNHAVPHNVNWTEDKFGKPNSALLLDGLSSYLESPIHVNPHKVPHFTMTAWVRSDGGTGNQHVISHDDGGYDRSLCIYNNRGKAGWTAFSGYGRALGMHPVTGGEWVFLAVIYDQRAHGVTFRVNDKVYFTKGVCSAGLSTMFIGKNPSHGEYFKGAVDQVRMYSRILTKRELDELHSEFLGDAGSQSAGSRMVVPSASHCCSWDSIDAICDGIEPKRSSDQKVPRHSWFPRRGTTEWVQLDFQASRKVSNSEVYWFDDTKTGACRVPESARILYKSGNEWKPVVAKGNLGVDMDQWNRMEFEEVETTAMRLEAQLKPGFTAGVLEWKAN